MMSEEFQRSLYQADVHAFAANTLASVPQARPWEIVARFYSAIHLINAYLMTRTPVSVPQSHIQREQLIFKVMPFPRSIQPRFAQAYSRLRDLSEQVRYRAGFVPTESHYALSSAAQSDLEHIVRPYLEGTDPQTQRAG